MTSTERAKRFLQNRARTLALAAMPLAALVNVEPAAANGVLLSFGSPSCGGSGTNASITVNQACNASLLPTMANGVNGVTMTGDATGTSVVSGGTFAVNFDWSGNTNGVGFTGLPVAYMFTILAGNPSAYSWSLNFNLGGTPTLRNGTGSGTMTFTGTALANVGTATSFDTSLSASQIGNPGDTLRLQVASGHIDINPAQVPEPSSLLLVSPVLSYLILRRRRKKA